MDAEYIEGDVKAYSMLPYYAERIAGPRWQIVGDAASFMDPLYSQGLDYCAWTVSAAVDRIVRASHGENCDVENLNVRFARSYCGWFEALYKDKYYYLGDKELMTAAFLMDLGLFFFGPVRSVVRCPKSGFSQFPFEGSFDGVIVRRLMAFYNRRLTRIAQKRHAAGIYGSMNLDSRTLLKGFEPTGHVWKLILRGVRTWLGAELRSLPLRSAQAVPLSCPAPSL